jgi:hypothetical protein
MFRRSVTSPDGTKWKLGRRWFPRWKKLGRADVGDFGPDIPDFGGDDLGIIGTILLAIFLVIAAIFLVLVLFNVVAIAIELMIFIVVALAGFLGRVVFRKPWTVFASSKGMTHERQVVGWRDSRVLIDDMATRLASGLELPAGDR